MFKNKKYNSDEKITAADKKIFDTNISSDEQKVLIQDAYNQSGQLLQSPDYAQHQNNILSSQVRLDRTFASESKINLYTGKFSLNESQDELVKSFNNKKDLVNSLRPESYSKAFSKKINTQDEVSFLITDNKTGQTLATKENGKEVVFHDHDLYTLNKIHNKDNVSVYKNINFNEQDKSINKDTKQMDKAIESNSDGMSI